MKRVLSVLSFLFLASCSSVPQKSQNFELKEILVPLEGLKIYHYQHLSNGLNIYLSPGFAKHMVSYVTAYNVGSRDEKKGQIGLAHLFEHLMFRGTRDFKDPFAALSSMGARFNAYTSQDQTVYYADVPSINLEKLIHLESDRMRNLKIDEEGFFKERGAVVSERKLNTVDSPGGRMFWELFKLAYEKHPYKYTPIGRQEDLDRVTFQNTLSFYEEHYAPQSASIAIVGDFQVSQVLKLMDHYYGAFQRKSLPKASHIVQENLSRPLKRKIIHLKMKNSFLVDARFAPPIDSHQSPVEFMLCMFMAHSDLGILRNELVDKGFAQKVSSYCLPAKDPGLSAYMVYANNDVSAEVLEKKYLDVYNSFPAWLTPERFKKLQIVFEGANWYALREPSSIAKDIATMATMLKDPLHNFKVNESFLKITREEVIKQFYERQKMGGTRILFKASRKSDPFQ